MATEKGVWDIQDVRDKIIASEWDYDGAKQLWVWGQNERGQLGQNQPHTSHVSSPVQIPGTWSFVTPKLAHAFDRLGILGVKTDGTLWGWGGNPVGMLGLNAQSSSPDEQGFVSSPTQVGSDTNWSWGCTGYRVSMFNKTDGTTWIWGNGGDGMLGLNATVSYSSPVQLPGSWANGRDKFGSGHNVMLAINGAGELMSWGENTYGNLGANLGHGTKRSSPIQIASGTWSTVCDGGYEHMGAVNDDGELWLWGKGHYGNLGQGSRTAYSSPRQVPGTNWVKCALTEHNTMASKSDGTLWVMGRNEHGNLGMNNREATGGEYLSPVQIGSDTNWDTINFQLGDTARAMKTDGTLWAWGRQNFGQFGDNSITARSSPVQIPGTDWHMIDGMYQTTFAIKEQ